MTIKLLIAFKNPICFSPFPVIFGLIQLFGVDLSVQDVFDGVSRKAVIAA